MAGVSDPHAVQRARAHANYGLLQRHRSEASALLKLAGGDEKRAIQRFAWAQVDEFRGKELLCARMAAAVDALDTQSRAAQSGKPASVPVAELKKLAKHYDTHRVAYDKLPPAPPIKLPTRADNPMQPVPNIKATVNTAKAELTPQYLQEKQAEGLSYQGTGMVIYVRHGETNHNANPGGVTGGSLNGPHGAQLLPQARMDARALRGTMQALVNQGDVAEIQVSPIQRARETLRYATQDVKGLPKVVVDARHSEYRVGGLFGLPKIALGNAKYVSKNGIWYGRTAANSVGIDFNNQSRDWVPPREVALPSTPRFGGTPVRRQPETESRNQHAERSAQVLVQQALPKIVNGKAVVVFSHQFSIGNSDFAIYGDQDYMKTGHGIPNVAPQYMVVHVFKDAQGNLVPIGATAGQGDLAPPGVTPKNQKRP